MNPTSGPSKSQLRREFLERRRAMSEFERARQSDVVVQRLVELPQFASARSIASFWPIPGNAEVDLRQLDVRARALGKRVYYPWVKSGSPLACGLRRVDEIASMVSGPFGTREPTLDAPEAVVGDVELIIVPALAATKAGVRLGYGAGCYDRLLGRFSPPSVSVAVVFSTFLVGHLPADPHDRLCDVVVTGT